MGHLPIRAQRGSGEVGALRAGWGIIEATSRVSCCPKECSADPDVIATAFERFCREQLGAGVRGALFYQASIGAVAGLELEDGRRLV